MSYDAIKPIALRLLRGDVLRLRPRDARDDSHPSPTWTATAVSLTADGDDPFIESDAYEVARAIVVMELRDEGSTARPR